jgi:hypothetical protein
MSQREKDCFRLRQNNVDELSPVITRRAGVRGQKSGLAEEQIDDPAAAHVLARLPAVGQDVRVIAAGIFQRVGENG